MSMSHPSFFSKLFFVPFDYPERYLLSLQNFLETFYFLLNKNTFENWGNWREESGAHPLRRRTANWNSIGRARRRRRSETTANENGRAILRKVLRAFLFSLRMVHKRANRRDCFLFLLWNVVSFNNHLRSTWGLESFKTFSIRGGILIIKEKCVESIA